MMELSGQLIFVLLLFIIYLLPRVYKNFLLTCAVYIALIVADGDQYFKICASYDNYCKIINISFIIFFGIHVIFGILLILGDIKKNHTLMLPWMMWWCMPFVGIIFIASNDGNMYYFAIAGWMAVMCADIYFFKYKKCKDSLDVSIEEQGDDFGSCGKLELINAPRAKFHQSDLWC